MRPVERLISSPSVRVPARLHERALGVRTLTPEVAVRAQGILFIAAGLVGALGVVLPHPDSFAEGAMLSVQAGCVASGVLLLAVGARMPRFLLLSAPFLGALITSGVLVLSGTSTSPYVLFYVWIVVYAYYFLPRRSAAVLTLFSVANYAAVIAGFRAAEISSPHPADLDVSALVLLAGTLGVAATFLLMLREKVGGLIAQLSDAAATDPLTGLANRREFHRSIEVELARSEPSQRPFALVLADCDYFKEVNDRLGHHGGDEALRGVATLLTKYTRKIDLAARIGGEEFALILPEADAAEAYLAAEQIRTRLRAHFAERPVPLTMSFGIAAYPADGEDPDELLRAADGALYAAKALGRDRAVVHSPEIAEIAEQQTHGHSRDDAHLATVLNLAEALDVRDTGTARHSQTVGRYAKLMARELALPADRVERVRIAGVLHDIGKIGVPDAILRKPGALSVEEWEHMRRHPETGARILGGSALDDIREWIVAHHERPDGRGYPHRLKGPDIPLEARILSVADAYEAMTSDRVYRKALGAEAARRELERGAGTQFDETVVAAFLRVLERREEELEPALPGALPVSPGLARRITR